MKKASFVLGQSIFIMTILSPSAHAAPKWVRITPSSDSTSSIYITWNTESQEGSKVQYGLDQSYGSEAQGTEDDVGGAMGIVHSAELTGLTPDTLYHYRVGDQATGWSDDHTFRTAPADQCTPFSFGIAADNRGNLSGTSTCWASVFEQISEQGVSFVINSGDLVMDGSHDNEWKDFLDTSEPWMADVALIPCIGNHDDDSVDGDGALYNRIFTLPRNNVDNTEDFYSFDYGNTHFAAISMYTSDFNTQYAWLEQDLSTTTKMWKVVYFHTPVYSSGSHGSNEDGKTWGYIPLFDQYHVDLVFTGHDHIYERYKPMRGGQVVSSYDEGTCYMVSGGGGAAMDPIYSFRPKEDGLEVGDAKHHYVHITISNNIMHIRTQRVSGTGCFQGGEGVIDEFDIVKTLQDDPCAGSTDSDNDGFSPPADCNDNDPDIHPGAEEICGDGIDQNCDGLDQSCPCEDSDSDGFESATCGGEDCDDEDPYIKPGGIEQCDNQKDDDCDAETDESDCQSCSDQDGDGYMAQEEHCPSGDDCNDSEAEVYPGAFEWCNDIDDDCDGQTDEGEACASGCTDADQDGYDGKTSACPSGDDCNDSDATINPEAQEACNLVDDDCDGNTDEDLGTRSCGVGVCKVDMPVCENGQIPQCVPAEPAQATEALCDDGLDNDCDGKADMEDEDCKLEQQPPPSGCGCRSSNHDSSGWYQVLMLLGFLVFAGRKKNI